MAGRRSRYARRRPVTVERRRENDTSPVSTERRRDDAGGRILESRGATPDGGRIFHSQIVAAGVSRNGVRYSETVLSAAARLYEGAKAFDGHRTDAEMNQGALRGLVGHWRNVTSDSSGIRGDLYLLPGASHVAEALDASIAAQGAGLGPLVGISHDVQSSVVPAVAPDGQRIREATAIHRVYSADTVADPSAGGRVLRVVASEEPEPVAEDAPPTETATTNNPPKEASMNLKELLAALKAATAEERAALLKEHAAVLEGSGYSAGDVPVLLGEADTGGEPEPAAPAPAPVANELAPAEQPEPAREPAMAGAPAPAAAGEETHARESVVGRWLIREAVTGAGLAEAHVQQVTRQLPGRFTEAQVLAEVDRIKETIRIVGGDVPAPKAGASVHVTEENLDKKRKRLEASFDKNWAEGYTRISEAYLDITGLPSSKMFDHGLGHEIIKESWGGPCIGGHIRESMTTTSWGEVLADVMNKRMLRLYNGSRYQDWTRFCDRVPVLDFKSQKLIRVGGYGTLPTVSEGAPYQPLTSPTDEQVTYSVSKKGGTEDYTFEMAKNDDMRKLVVIPEKLARAAAITIYRAVFDLITSNPTMPYDSVALFHASHGNTTAGTTLSESGLDTLRQKMRDQAAYGDSVDVLGLLPRFLIVPNELENTANKLARGAAALPSSGYASDQPNLHVGIDPIIVDYFTDANDYFVVADPADVPFIEVGFLDGVFDPGLFMQDDPSVGSVFTADKVTWKIRHIWGLTVADHRAVQRMTN